MTSIKTFPDSCQVLVCDEFTVGGLQSLRSALGEDKVLKGPAKDCKAARALVVRSKTRVNEATAGHLRGLELVVTSTSGFDHVDLAWCNKMNIKVFNSPDAHRAAVAELTFFLMIGLLRRVQEHQVNMRTGGWRDQVQRGLTLRQKTLGIVGLGRIGQFVAARAKAFGMQIIAADPHQEGSVFAAAGAERLGLTEVIRQADIITLHIPYDASTHEFINSASLAEVSMDALLINTSRGSVVREPDVIELLRRQKLGGFGADVFKQEPLDTISELYKLPRAFITPHIGAYAQDAFEDACLEAAQTVLDYFSGSLTKTELNP